MKLSKSSCVTALWLSSCLTVVTMATTSTPETTEGQSTLPQSSISSVPTATGSSLSTGSSPVSASSNASTTNSTESDNSTNTSPTTQSGSSPSTQAPILCKNGTCVGNATDSRCMNDTITDTCIITDSQHCYQIAFTNSTDTVYEVGCRATCEYLQEETAEVTQTTRCCNTNMCNEELLPDPDPENSAINKSMSFISVVLVLLASKIFA